jgi:hypothetical protein
LTMQQCKVALLLLLLAKLLQSNARVPLGTSVLSKSPVFILHSRDSTQGNRFSTRIRASGTIKRVSREVKSSD